MTNHSEFQKSFSTAVASGEYAAFVVWHDTEKGLYRLDSCHAFPQHAKTRFDRVREMISAKIQEFVGRLVKQPPINLSGIPLPPGVALPPGTIVGPEIETTVQMPRPTAGQNPA